MNDLSFFLPCAAGVEEFLAQEVHALTGRAGQDLLTLRGGVRVRADWRDGLKLNLHSRLAQRVLVELAHAPYRNENDLYAIASGVAWEIWFTPKQTFKIETTAQHSPLQSLNFATLRIKDAIADRFRAKAHGVRPSIETQWPDCRVFAHLTTDHCTLYIDTSGEPLFKRGWRQDKGDAPLKETLAAAMLAASGWWNPETGAVAAQALYDPCCGSGTIAIEAAQIARGIPAGSLRQFGFEKLLPFQAHVWTAIKKEAESQVSTGDVAIFGSDVSHRMVDFSERNAERAGVADAIEFRGGDALQRMPPAEGGVIMLNPPYGERIEVGGVARFGAREAAQTSGDAEGGDGNGGDFFPQLATHWKKNYAGWTAWVLTPDLKLPKQMRLKESRRVPMWNGPIECRLFRFDLVRGSNRAPQQEAAE
ncbi:class I SAM-dependent RNA methyltransferase [Variovorax sp. PAMC26660]|uniref:THUMP domain-containing class I SAM-dependent RNA methyltransferase n=1 Tax=Variovorax sp. PAMC26660 TaxID=2762322 RepID=UPI00164D14CB|nr:THUMP domain-containing protein [Variovorax sp. PAMC26660]QNK70900.1 class I SAM-dependent RNA methyltransferase [Variovorax sp. PAMC26660]